jgi:drug/metabolite transporter (DMT)-like permease
MYAIIVALLGLGAIFYSAFSKRGRERARGQSPSEKKMRLYVACALMSVLMVFVACNILMCHLHHVPILNVLWIGLLIGVFGTAATARAIMRLAPS